MGQERTEQTPQGVRSTEDMFDGTEGGVQGYEGKGPNATPRWHGGAEQGDALNGEYDPRRSPGATGS